MINPYARPATEPIIPLMVLGDVRDIRVDSEPLLTQHRAALFELRENLARLKKLLDIEETSQPLPYLDYSALQPD